MMIPIGICSLIALAVIAERFISLRRQRVIPPDFLDGVKATLQKGENDRSEALEYCRKDGSPVAHIFEAAIRRLSAPLELLERHIEQAGEREVLKLRKFLRVLAVIASTAPLMGLLGTIFGMIRAFSTVASSGQALGRTELLARGIYEALITTAAGLSIAIPVLIGYHWINAKITRLVGEMDLMTVDFVEDYAELGPNGSGAQPTSEPGKLRITAEEEGGDTDVEPADEPEDETVATAS
jgi:biopolymer transport protein ExbB